MMEHEEMPPLPADRAAARLPLLPRTHPVEAAGSGSIEALSAPSASGASPTVWPHGVYPGPRIPVSRSHPVAANHALKLLPDF